MISITGTIREKDILVQNLFQDQEAPIAIGFHQRIEAAPEVGIFQKKDLDLVKW